MRLNPKHLDREKTPRKGRTPGWSRGSIPCGGVVGRSGSGSAPAAPYPAHLCSPTSVFRQPSITRPGVTHVRPRGLGVAGAHRRAGTCAGGPFTGAGRRGRSGSSPPRARAAAGVRRPAGPQAGQSPLPWGCVRAETGPSPGATGVGRSSASRLHPRPANIGGSVKTPWRTGPQHTAIQKPKVHC